MANTILIVEDNADALDLLRMYFEFHGFTVHCARDGVEGWESVTDEPPSLVLSDYLMPKLDGIGLCEKMKDDPAYAKIPFVLVTGTPHLPDSALPDAVMSKPLKLDRLMEYVERVLDIPPSGLGGAPAF